MIEEVLGNEALAKVQAKIDEDLWRAIDDEGIGP
jgi:hypothetical protein